jgi:hypothetical protein
MDDGTIVDTDKATATWWREDTYWDGHNSCSSATGSQWDHQQLYASRKGRYYLVHWSQWAGTRASAEWISNQAAAQWLLVNNHQLPADLAVLADEVSE